ncbi:transcription factor IIIB 60 kDa subunit-like isoform X2 [Triticum dicoccoides]|uniref:transcription factor IIIB 60 kDa subunit-like isoform X2 n=1 Tax=Triticum dicoccoides TaxID=85692 RepID=UPI000E7BB027|nr:transcription factor IIIB 60 kDa subunit-like isoform X2 [Triticum dicoccoides]XP_044368795.1 transcription factor IIIB 60 kDa subunit-like isoform X2 [Triticum aestivum]
MVYCSHCDDDCPYVKDPDNGFTCCGMCGKVIDQDMYTDEPTFVKDSSGQSRLSGHIIGIAKGGSLSRERTEEKGRDEIWQIVHGLHVSGGDDIICTAHNFYKLALDNNFTRGRRTTHVAASCLYIACRRSEKPYLLIDFSDYLHISVYVLGAIFLQLCQVLLLGEHPIVQKLVDPSLFIHRFTERLLGKRDNAVSDTALRIVASMKRDWMQTGRKPSGLCGAALYIAALSHGHMYTKADIIEDFLAKADEEPVSKCLAKSGEVLCEHKDKGAEHFSHGLCEECYDNFTELSGGLEGGADPPAFQRAEKQRLDAAKRAKEAAVDEAICELHNSDFEDNIMSPGKKSEGKSSAIASSQIANDFVDFKDSEVEGENGKTGSDAENLSDIDDAEVDGYLHSEEETQTKKIIWEEMNKEYLEEQAAKEALAAELAARGVSVGEGRQKKRKRNEDKNSTPAETPAEATYNMLKRKGLGSKVNVEAVSGLYKIEDEDGKANGKDDMHFDEHYEEDTGYGETFDVSYDYGHDADYNNDGYVDDGGGGAYEDYHDADY